jgi:uncharacterized protein YgiM (DUF1202 family)
MYSFSFLNDNSLFKRLFALLSFSVFLFSASATNAQLGKAGSKSTSNAVVTSKIITGTSVRVRAEPNTSGKEVTSLNFGTIVKSSGRSPKKDKVGGKEDYWYKVTTEDKKSGWVFGGFLTNYDEKKREGIFLIIASDRLKSESADFDDFADLVNFLTRVTNQVKEQNNVAELELYKLQALAKSLEKMPFDKQTQSPYKDWTEKNSANIVYSEPAGQWFVRAKLFWDLSARYRTLAVSDRIAWAAANTPLPGECEGYLPCHIFYLRETLGEYLKLYPNGKYVTKAIEDMSAYLAPMVNDSSIYTGPQDETERAEMKKHLTELRSFVQGTNNAKKEIVLNYFDQILKTYSTPR